jgi:hypothetical protein
MNTSTLSALLQIAALLHVGLIIAGASMPQAVNLQVHLAVLPPFIRRLFLVYYAFIGLMLAGFGCLTSLFANAMASGEPLARAFCILLTAFWGLRVIVAALVFDLRPYLKTWLHRLGYYALNFVFVYLLLVYAVAAWKGGRL